MIFTSTRAIVIFALVHGVMITSSALSQNYPVRPVRVVVPNAPGSSGDIVARFVAPPLAERLGQPVIVDNRAGAGTMIGTETVARAVPDGYTLLMGFATLAINPVMYKKVPYDALRDFVPITHLVSVPALVAVHPSLPAKSIRDLIALAKSKPGQIAFASSGQGTFSHVSSELLLSMANVRMLHVPYKGTAGATPLITGEASLQISNLLTMLPHARSGRIRALALTSLTRAISAPDIPTVAESGLPGYESVQWLGLLAPAATPAEIVNRLNREAVAVVRSAELKERLARDGAEAIGNSPAEFGSYIRSETAKWSKVLRAAGVKPQ